MNVWSATLREFDALIGQLLTLSRLEAGLPLGERENVNFTLLVQEVVADGNFEAQSLGKSVSLESSSPVVLETADSLALRSACENIVRNAIHFTRPGTEVNVALGVDNAASSRQVFLTVRDQGPGVPGKAVGLGSQLRSRPFGCTTGLSPLQISIRRGSRLASGCPRQILPERNVPPIHTHDFTVRKLISLV